MTEIGQDTCAIDFLTRVDPCPGGLRLTFYRGLGATLCANHPDFDIFLHSIEYSLVNHYMLGLHITAAGDLVDLNHATQSHVRFIREDEEAPDRLEIALWGHSSVCYLRRDHPDFERIRHILEEALASGDLVWYATHTRPEKVVTEHETWIGSRLMDVRPVTPGTEWGREKMPVVRGITGVNGQPQTDGASAGSEATRTGT
jgi:hypothetical protein